VIRPCGAFTFENVVFLGCRTQYPTPVSVKFGGSQPAGSSLTYVLKL